MVRRFVRRPMVRRAIQGVALVVVLGFLGLYMARQWPAVREVSTPSLGWCAAALAIGLGSLLVSAWNLRRLLGAHGHWLPYARVLAAYYVPGMGKYVPGKVWTVVGAIILLEAEGVPRRVSLSYIAISQIVTTAGSIVLAAAFAGSQVLPDGQRWLLAALVVLLAMAIHPACMQRIMNAGLRVLGRDGIAVRVPYASLLSVFAMAVFVTVMYSAGFVMLVGSVVSLDFAAIGPIIGVFAVSQVSGILAVFAPAGIGVREGVLVLGLAPLVGPGPAIVASVLARVWQTALDVAMFSLGLAALRLTPKTQPEIQVEPQPACAQHAAVEV